jgi:hypothetical protein
MIVVFGAMMDAETGRLSSVPRLARVCKQGIPVRMSIRSCVLPCRIPAGKTLGQRLSGGDSTRECGTVTSARFSEPIAGLL